MEDGGGGRSGGQSYDNIENSQEAFIGAIYTSAYHTKQLSPWPNSSASYMVSFSWLSACQGKMESFRTTRALMHGYLTSLRNNPQQSSLSKYQQQYPDKLLVNVYSYCLRVKCVSCSCVCGS